MLRMTAGMAYDDARRVYTLMRGLPAAACAIGLALAAGCASVPPPQAPKPPPASYVMLVTSPDGTTGAISVTGPRGTTVLDQPRQRALLDGSGAAPAISDAQADADFAAARAAQPPLPLRFILYFETGTTKLTAESERQLSEVVERVRERSGVDLSIIGHTDSVGQQVFNERLGLQRAQIVATLLNARGLAATGMNVLSAGERDPLIKVPDETAEPRNRRVEVYVR